MSVRGIPLVQLASSRPGASNTAASVDPGGHLEVAIHGPVSAFGEVVTVSPTPRVQIDAVYGLLNTDTETLTDGVSGSATAAASLFTCTTGTTPGGYAVIRSRRMVHYLPGQGLLFRLTAGFPSTAVANSLVIAGGLNAEDGLFVGYSGTTFGLLRRIAGSAAIHRLTVTAGAGGVETITVTLNGVAFTVATAGALSTTATAEAIAERVGGYTGWTSGVSPTSNGATVTFIQGTPGTAGGTFTLSSTGTAAGTFATVRAGAANDSATGFVAQTAWNIDRLDGTGGDYNPSGLLLDPAKLNVWQFSVPYLGAGAITMSVMAPNGEMAGVHRIEYPNAYTVPSFKNPSFRLGWVAASLGSTTNLQINGASAAGFIEGAVRSTRDPFGAANLSFSASTTEYVALAIRVRGEFSGVLNQRECIPILTSVGNETANRLLTVRAVLNPTMTGTVNWAYVDQTVSAMEYATPTNIAATGGRILPGAVVSTNGEIPLDRLDLRLEPGDVLVVTVATVSNTATAAVLLNWLEQ